MIYKTLALAALASAAASRSHSHHEHPTTACTLTGSDFCDASPPIGGETHVSLPPGTVDTKRRRYEAKEEEEPECTGGCPGRRRLTEKGAVDEEAEPKTRFEKHCLVAKSKTSSWFHFSTDEESIVPNVGSYEADSRLYLDVKAEHPLGRQGFPYAHAEKQLAVWGPYDSLHEMQHACGWDHDDKLMACTQDDGADDATPKIDRGNLDTTDETNTLWTSLGGATRLEHGKYYAVMIGGEYAHKDEGSDYRVTAKSYGGSVSNPGQVAVVPSADTTGCVDCDQFWDGASTADIGHPICHRVTTQVTHPLYTPLLGVHDGTNALAIAKGEYFGVETDPSRLEVQKPRLEVPDKRRKLSRDHPEYETLPQRECRPAKLPEELDHDHLFGADSPVHNVHELAKLLHAIGAEPCPVDHALGLADHYATVLPDCKCDIYPDAHGSIKYLADHVGHTMCMKITHRFEEGSHFNTAGEKRRNYHLDSACYDPNPEYPHVGVDDGGIRTWLGCRADMVPCVHRGFDAHGDHTDSLSPRGGRPYEVGGTVTVDGDRAMIVKILPGAKNGPTKYHVGYLDGSQNSDTLLAEYMLGYVPPRPGFVLPTLARL